MPQPTVSPAHTGRADSLDFAFYEALQGADLDKVMACWSLDEHVLHVRNIDTLATSVHSLQVFH